MTPTKVPYLCGGILFSLILQARKTRTKARDKLKGGSDGLKDTDVMMGLVEVVTGDCFDSAQGTTFGKCTSQFKTCQDYGTTYIPFTDPSVISSFNSLVNKKDPAVLKRMTEFINRFINSAKTEWLVKAIFEVLQNDNEISDDTSFMVSSSVITAKNDIESISEVELPFLLLSTLDFILKERPDNTKGRKTFEMWHQQKTPQSQWKYIGSVGNTISRSIKVAATVDVDTVTPIESQNNCIEAAPTEKTKTASERLNEKILASGKVLADVWGKAIEAIADDMDSKAETTSEKPRLVIDNLNEEDAQYLKQIRKQAKPILKYCIENDPSAGDTKLSLADELADFNRNWQFEVREITDYALRTLLNDIMQVFDEYSYYISDKFLKLIPERMVLWFRNESLEEGKQLREVLRPETIKKRYEMRDIYLRLYPVPEDDKTQKQNATIIQQQTNVVQNGDNNINLTNNGTINFKM